jgi:hypothetical protein
MAMQIAEFDLQIEIAWLVKALSFVDDDLASGLLGEEVSVERSMFNVSASCAHRRLHAHTRCCASYHTPRLWAARRCGVRAC